MPSASSSTASTRNFLARPRMFRDHKLAPPSPTPADTMVSPLSVVVKACLHPVDLDELCGEAVDVTVWSDLGVGLVAGDQAEQHGERERRAS